MNVYYLRLYSLLALLGVVLTCVGEFFYFYGFEGTNQQVRVEFISQTKLEHISTGMYCGILGIGLWLFITYPLRVALHRTSFAMRQWIQAALLIYIGCALVFHVTMGFIGMNEHIATLLDTGHTGLSDDVRSHTHYLFMIVVRFSIFSSVLITVLYSWAIFKGNTYLPKWSVIFTPLSIYILFKMVPSWCMEIPSPYGGWLDIASGCIGLFFLFSIIILAAVRNVNT